MAAVPGAAPTSYRPLVALSLVDALAQALRVRGAYPPPLGATTCEVTGTVAPAVLRFDPPLQLTVVPSPSGYLLIDGTYTRRGDGAPPRWLSPGTYSVRVRNAYYQDTGFALVWPPPQVRVADAGNQPVNLAMLPGANYPVPDTTLGGPQLGPTVLRGSARDGDGAPLSGIAVQLVNFAFLQPPPNDLPALPNWQPLLQATTDATGAWAIVLPGRRYFDATPEIPPAGTPLPLTHALTLSVHYPAGARQRVENVLLGSSAAVRNTVLQGLVLGSSQVPQAGVRIGTNASATVVATGPDGRWTIYFPFDQGAVAQVAVTATAPNGAAHVANVPIVPRTTVTVPTFHFP